MSFLQERLLARVLNTEDAQLELEILEASMVLDGRKSLGE
jgi:hypothetical protein